MALPQSRRPFMMLGRITSDQVTLPEVLLSIALLVSCIVGTLWLAARIYTAGVLLYGRAAGRSGDLPPGSVPFVVGGTRGRAASAQDGLIAEAT